MRPPNLPAVRAPATSHTPAHPCAGACILLVAHAQTILSAMSVGLGDAGSDGGSTGDQELPDVQQPNGVLPLNGINSNQTTASSSVGRQQLPVSETWLPAVVSRAS